MDEEWGEFNMQPMDAVGAAPAPQIDLPNESSLAAGAAAISNAAPIDQWSEFNLQSASDFNKDAFAGKFTGPLASKADLIEEKANQYGVPPALASAIIAQETGWGKSIGGNNVAGMMRGSQKMQFGSLDEGIDRAVSNIAKQYERSGQSLEGLRDIYAPLGAKNDPRGLNKDWLPGVSKIMGMFQP